MALVDSRLRLFRRLELDAPPTLGLGLVSIEATDPATLNVARDECPKADDVDALPGGDRLQHALEDLAKKLGEVQGCTAVRATGTCLLGNLDESSHGSSSFHPSPHEVVGTVDDRIEACALSPLGIGAEGSDVLRPSYPGMRRRDRTLLV